MKILKAWLEGATKDRRLMLTKRAHTSVNSLWQIGHGLREASAKKAAEIEAAAKSMKEPLRRGDIAKTCSECPYYRKIIDKQELL